MDQHPLIEWTAVSTKIVSVNEADTQLTDLTKGLHADFLKASIPDIYLENVETADWIYMISWLCHADIENRNKDMFLSKDLKFAMADNQISHDKPLVIDINHSVSPAVGMTMASYMMHDEEAGVNGIMVRSVVFGWGPYKAVASKVVELAKSGELAFSMMCRPEFVECGTCHKLANKPEDYCSHLTSQGEDRATRIVRYPTFVANSIIIPPNQPADSFARPLVLAGLMTEESLESLVYLGDNVEGKEHKSNGDNGSEGPTGGEIMEELQKKLTQAETELATAKTALAEAEAKLADSTAKINELGTVSASLESVNSKVVELETANLALVTEKTELAEKVEKLEKAQKDAKIASRLAEFKGLNIELSDEETAFVQSAAENQNDVEWSAYVAISKKIAAKVIDPELAASLALGEVTESPAPTDELMPNIKRVTNKKETK